MVRRTALEVSDTSSGIAKFDASPYEVSLVIDAQYNQVGVVPRYAAPAPTYDPIGDFKER